MQFKEWRGLFCSNCSCNSTTSSARFTHGIFGDAKWHAASTHKERRIREVNYTTNFWIVLTGSIFPKFKTITSIVPHLHYP